jgi:hypothetical protein
MSMTWRDYNFWLPLKEIQSFGRAKLPVMAQ